MMPILDGRHWLGDADGYGTQFTAGLWESAEHPGYYHYAVLCFADYFYDGSRRPILAGKALGALDGLLERMTGFRIEELRWTETPIEQIPFAREGAAS